MNYTELCTAIQDYSENTFSPTQLATFVYQAEQRIYNTVQLPPLRKNVTGTLSVNNQYLSSPSDFLSVFSLAVIGQDNSYEYLLNKDVNFIREAFPYPATIGKPTHYAIFGSTTTSGVAPVITNELSFIVGPTPDANYSVELHYYYYPESITVAVSGHSWLGDNFDSALLYGALCEAITFMKGEADMVAGYNNRYLEALGLLKNLGDGKLREDAYRSGQVRVKVL